MDGITEQEVLKNKLPQFRVYADSQQAPFEVRFR